MTHVSTTTAHPSPEHPVVSAFRALPVCEAYTDNFQPTYKDSDAVLDAMHELHETEAVTTPRQVDALQEQLSLLAEGKIAEPIIITDRCAEEINLETPIEILVGRAVSSRRLVLDALGKAIVVQRNRGQATKPRSAATEISSSGKEIPSYKGDAVNGIDESQREPDPTRMVAMAVQSRDLEAGLTEAVGEHVPAAHEALLLPYEHSFVREDPATGKKYLLSTDLPWIGKRTNAIDGAHVRLLAQVENPIGIKIGSDSTPQHIAQLAAVLNPSGKAGKLVFMLRLEPGRTEELATILDAVKEHAPKSILMYDIHGVTRTDEKTGKKIRYVGDIISGIHDLSRACRERGMKLHGAHLETTTDNSRLECTDFPDQLPTHPGGVDPQLNPRQTTLVLEKTKEYFL